MSKIQIQCLTRSGKTKSNADEQRASNEVKYSVEGTTKWK